MTSSPNRPPWETLPWRSFHQSLPEVPPAKSIGTLGVLAIAAGVGVLGYFMLDGHSHSCEACGHRWRHLGAFNLGDATAHTCKKCGTVQWWKDGFQHVFRDPLYVSASEEAPGSISQQRQEIREVPQPGLPSGTFAVYPPGVQR
jgi:hypothetical protein